MADKPRKKAEDALLLALACGASVDQAARQCGLSPRTVYRRLAEAEFRRRLQALRADMVSRTAGTLTAAASEAVRTLLELLKRPASDAVRLGAARAVLEMGMKVREVADLEERLSALEQQAGEADAGRP
jgi:transposase-like protein